MQYFVNAIGIIVIIVGIIMVILLVVLLREKRSLNNHKQRQNGIENYYEAFDRIQRELTDLRSNIEELKGKTEHFVESASGQEKDTMQSFNNPFSGNAGTSKSNKSICS